MISTDSLQVLDNEMEMVQSAITSARGTGLLIGMIIGILVMALILYIVTLVNKRDMQWMEKEHALWKYRRMKMEMGWVDMIRVCKDCIDGDIRIAKPTADLFNEFPGYDEERRNKEVQLFPRVAQKYQELINDRSEVVNTLQTMIDRDIEYINEDIKFIESKYPVETAQYNKKHEEYIKKKQTNNG
jgi:hypothetical protein